MKPVYKLFLFFLLSNYYFGYSQTSFEETMGFPTINDSKSNFKFAIDTGASTTFYLNKEISNNKWKGFFIASDSHKKFKIYNLRQIDLTLDELGKVKTKGIFADQLPACLAIDVFFGLDVINDKTIHYDFVKNNLTISDGISFNKNHFTEISLSTNIYGDEYYVNMNINGNDYKLLLDTGYSGKILINSPEKLDLPYQTYDSYSNSLTTRKSEIQFVFLDVPVEISNFKINQEVKSGKMNLVGIGFLKQFNHVIIDLKNNKLFLSKKTNSEDNNTQDEIFFYVNDNREIEINTLRRESELYNNGFRVGDKIKFSDKKLELSIIENPCDVNKLVEEWRVSNSSFPLFTKVTP